MNSTDYRNKVFSFEPLVIISNSISGGGAEKSMLSLHQSFIQEKINSNFIALNRTVLTSDLINVKLLNRVWNDGLISTFLTYIELKKYIKEINPRFLIVNCELPELYTAFLNTKNRKIICVEHTTKPWHKRVFLGIFVRLILKLKKVTWVTVINNKSKVWLGQRHARYIPNPFVEGDTLEANINRDACLAFIGSLKANKRPDWVIEAGINNNLIVHLYGEGPEKSNLETRFSRHMMRVYFHGYIAKVWTLIPKQALVVVPSDFEGDGMVVVEAAIQKFPLLLRNNKDLKRFAFDSKHYFNTLNELQLIIRNNLENNFTDLIVDSQKREELAKERSLKAILIKWRQLLLSLEEGNQ